MDRLAIASRDLIPSYSGGPEPWVRRRRPSRQRLHPAYLYLLEALESRTLLTGTFSYDLRLVPGQPAVSPDGHNVNLSLPHNNTYTMQLWAQFVGDDTLWNDVFSYGYVSVASTQGSDGGALTGGGIIAGNINTALFPATFSTNGAATDISHDGINDWGSGASSSRLTTMFWAGTTGYSFGIGYMDGIAVDGMSEPLASDPTHGWEVLVASFTVDVSNLAAPDQSDLTTNFSVIPPQQIRLAGVAGTIVPGVVVRGDGSTTNTTTGSVGSGVTFYLPANIAPAITDFAKSAGGSGPLLFSNPDFQNAFKPGASGGPLQSVQINSLPAHGILSLNSQPVALNQEIDAAQLGGLSYLPDANYSGDDSFTWSGSDGATWTDAAATVHLSVSAPAAPVSPAPANPASPVAPASGSTTGNPVLSPAINSQPDTFSYDLRLAPGQPAVSPDGHNVNLSLPHSNTYTMQLWAQFVGDDTVWNDVFSFGYVSVDSTQGSNGGALTDGGIIAGNINTVLFPGNDPRSGAANDISHDGISDWGSGGSSSGPASMLWIGSTDYGFALGYMDGNAVDGMSEPLASDPTHGWEVLVASFTVDVSNLAAPDQSDLATNFSVIPPKQFRTGIAILPGVVVRGDGSLTNTTTGSVGSGVTFYQPATGDPVDFGLTKPATHTAPTPFTPSDFQNAFGPGASGSPLQTVQINTLPVHGTLTLDSQPVAIGQQIDITQLAGLS